MWKIAKMRTRTTHTQPQTYVFSCTACCPICCDDGNVLEHLECRLPTKLNVQHPKHNLRYANIMAISEFQELVFCCHSFWKVVAEAAVAVVCSKPPWAKLSTSSFFAFPFSFLLRLLQTKFLVAVVLNFVSCLHI